MPDNNRAVIPVVYPWPATREELCDAFKAFEFLTHRAPAVVHIPDEMWKEISCWYDDFDERPDKLLGALTVYGAKHFRLL